MNRALASHLLAGAEEALVPLHEFGSLAPDLNPDEISSLAREAKSFAAYQLPSSVIGEVFFASGFERCAFFLVEVSGGEGFPAVWVMTGDVSPLVLHSIPGDTDLQAIVRFSDALDDLASGRVPKGIVEPQFYMIRSWRALENTPEVAELARRRAVILREWLDEEAERESDEG